MAQTMRESGIQIETKHLPWQRALFYMKSGQIDMIATIYYTEERAKFMDFTIPFVEVPTVVIVAKGKSFPFNKLNDLVGLKGIKRIGASLGQEYDKIDSKLNITEIKDELSMIKILEAGRADYAIGPKYIFIIEARKIGLEEKIEILPTPVILRGLRMAISKKSPFLKHLAFINSKIKQKQKDGTISKMIEKTINSAAIR